MLPLKGKVRAGTISDRPLAEIACTSLLGRSHSPSPATEPWPHFFEDALRHWAKAHGLTHTERLVVRGVVQGLSNKEIALSLGRTRSTVGIHVQHAYEKVRVSSRTELAFRFFVDAATLQVAHKPTGRPS
jgi:DNA-binding CsgD family transcriptional regulator